MLLTASILNGSSILTDDLEGQGTDNEDEIFDDEWIVPNVSLSFTQQDGEDLNQVGYYYTIVDFFPTFWNLSWRSGFFSPNDIINATPQL